MTLEDLGKLATGSLLFSLDRIIAPKLIRLLYLLGLFTILLWAVSHLFATFAFGFGAGLWGLLEIVVFGLLGFVTLRIVCEAFIVYFKANERAAQAASQPRAQASLIDEVRDAIEDLAEEEDSEAGRPVAVPAKPSTTSAPKKATTSKPATSARRKPAVRTAKRTPAKKPE